LIETNQILELGIRRQIYNFILKYPGLHLREISRKLNIPKTTLSYHIKYLEKRGLLAAKPEGKYTLYYVSNNIGNNQKMMLHLLRQETSRNIVLYFLARSCASRIELSKSLGKHPTTLDKPLKKLLEMDIIESAPVINGKVQVNYGRIKFVKRPRKGKEIIYRLKDCYSLNDSIILYQKRSFDDNFCDILPILYNMLPRKRSVKEIRSMQYHIEYIEKVLWDVIPHPYHV
jgi:predicted transcriptional regulator